MEIHGASLPTVNFIVINIMFGGTSAISVAAMVRNTQDAINSDTHIRTHTQPRYHWYTEPDNPSIWLPVSLFSCFTLSVSHSHKHNQHPMTCTAVCGGRQRGMKKGWLERVNVCLYASKGETQIERNKRKRKRRGEKTEWASIAK